MAKLSDVNFDALAQHYGLHTHLLDLTNDFRTALFFATCAYDENSDTYRPLTQGDIDKDSRSHFGCLFHAPNWTIDYLNGDSMFRLMAKLGPEGLAKPHGLQSGDLDGIAFQIGYQPLQRCDFQASYVFPMRGLPPLQEDWRFEKMRFRQTPELSRRVFEAMDGGAKVFPEEGITKLRDTLEDIRTCTLFSIDELEAAYEYDSIDRTVYPTVGNLRADLAGFTIRDGVVDVVDGVIEEDIPSSVLNTVNEQYNGMDLLERVGGEVRMKPDDREYLERRSVELFGEVVGNRYRLALIQIGDAIASPDSN